MWRLRERVAQLERETAQLWLDLEQLRQDYEAWQRWPVAAGGRGARCWPVVAHVSWVARRFRGLGVAMKTTEQLSHEG